MKKQDIEKLIVSNSHLITVKMKECGTISVNVRDLKEVIKKKLGRKLYKKYQEVIVECTEILRDRKYSQLRYSFKIKKQDKKYESLDYLINRSKKSARIALGRWLNQTSEWDTIGVLTTKMECRTEAEIESCGLELITYLLERQLISDAFYCVEYASKYHLNILCKANAGVNPNRLRRLIKYFWRTRMGICWVRKFYKSKSSDSYWVKDIYSNSPKLSTGCWDLLSGLAIAS